MSAVHFIFPVSFVPSRKVEVATESIKIYWVPIPTLPSVDKLNTNIKHFTLGLKSVTNKGKV
jgi:hypothetical protein